MSRYSRTDRYSITPDRIEDATTKFEKGRIAVLQQERVYIQKKTFTKWCNSFLEKAGLHINDLFTDLADGKMLMKLLEIISGENIGKPNKSIIRVQKVENINKSLSFLQTKVHLENIGAEDVLDGNERIILGLIWTIILRFQIQDIEIEVDEESQSSEKKSAKDALLLWCQRKTAGYPGVNITNFSSSWKNGLGFNALIDSHRPDLIKFEKLDPRDHIGNLNNAFDVADEKLGIAKLLDAEDVDQPRPDEKSIMTYVAAYYHYFAKMKSEMTGGKRIAGVMKKLMNVDQLEDDYETLVTTLLDWINQKIKQLNDRTFPNSIEALQTEMAKFKDYLVSEKPPKYRERGNVEVHLFNIQAKLKANGQRHYTPPEGKLVKDIETAWSKLEKAEYARERALRDELIRQERLQRLAAKFERKAALRESWLNDMNLVLSDQNFGNNTSQVEAALKKHEAISADILARTDRFEALQGLAKELCDENYYDKAQIKRRDEQIAQKWKNLLELLDKKKRMLQGYSDLLGMFREIESIQSEMKEMEPSLRSEDTGKHLLSVEDYIQKHQLQETEVNALGGRVRNLNKRAQPYMKFLHPETQLLQRRLEVLNKDFDNLYGLSNSRKSALESSRMFYQFLQDSEEEEAWLVEKLRLVRSEDTGRDLVACNSLIKRHEALEQEMQARNTICEQVCKVGEQLVNNKHYAHRDIQQRIKNIRDKWAKLYDLAKKRRTLLEDAAESHQYYADANEAESWIREKMPLVCSEDYGRDEASAQNLLQRHNRLEEEIQAYEQDIQRLDKLSTLMTQASDKHNIRPEMAAPKTIAVQQQESDDEDELEDEVIEVPYEYEIEEMREKEVIQEVMEERKVPQVKAIYPYQGQNMEVAKGEVLLLMQKTNNDWWSVRQANGKTGYMPANYVKEVEAKIVRKPSKKKVMVPEKVKVKKMATRKEVVKRKKSKASKLRRTPSVRTQGNLHFDRVNVAQRQETINSTYGRLVKLGQARHKTLEDYIKLYRFYNECDAFESWMIDKEQALKTKESLSENMEAMKRKFEALLTDLAANTHIRDKINDMADDMVHNKHAHTGAIKERQKQINDRWDNLHKLKIHREKTLEGASGIELFQDMCDELKGWMNEKMNTLDTDDVGKDTKSVEALRRKHQNLELELLPIEEKMKKMSLLAQSVRQSYPEEKGYVDGREKEIMDMWKALKEKADARKKKKVPTATLR